jgi:hypothetical protein
MIKLLLKGLKLGLVTNLILTFALIFYVIFVENWLTKPLSGSFKSPLMIGTIVDFHRLFAFYPPSMSLKKSWLNIQNKFSYFIVEYQLRADYKRPSPRLLNWCATRRCFAHRISYSDSRKKTFNLFTLDDWFTNIFLANRNISDDSQSLASFLRSLPSGSTVVISEPFATFSPLVLDQFFDWVLLLRSAHPQIRLEIGLQLHLQWIDAYWLNSHHWLIPAIARFSKTSGVPGASQNFLSTIRFGSVGLAMIIFVIDPSIALSS